MPSTILPIPLPISRIPKEALFRGYATNLKRHRTLRLLYQHRGMGFDQREAFGITIQLFTRALSSASRFSGRKRLWITDFSMDVWFWNEIVTGLRLAFGGEEGRTEFIPNLS